MKISFVHDWEVHYEQEYTWRDGLAAAIKELIARGHEVQFLVCGKRDSFIDHPFFPINVSTDIKRDVEAYAPDVVLMWGDCTRPNAEPVSQLGIPMALCFAGGQVDGPTMKYFQHFFVESEVYKQRFELMGQSVSTAFGTNTELFNPHNVKNQRKIFDVIFPATFAAWKRHRGLFSEATRNFLTVACGYFVQHEMFEVQYCEDAGNLVLPHVSAEALVRLYGASKICVITSIQQGGSQRTVLEAMAMNVPVIVMDDSDKTSEYVRACGSEFNMIVKPEPNVIVNAIQKLLLDTGDEVSLTMHPTTKEALGYSKYNSNSRQYILDNWSEYKYADALEAGLRNLCNS